MSKLGKIFMTLSAVAFISLMIARFVIGEWTNYLYAPLVLFVLFFVAAIVKDMAFYKEIMMMRTTKHGMNFGALVLIVIVLLSALNYVGFQMNKKVDVTEEKMNSLSDQSINVLKTLDSELEMVGFFKSGGPEDEREKFQFQDIASLYKGENSKVQVIVYDPIRRPDMAQKYKVEASGEVVISYKGKQNTISEISEEAITNAIIKTTRTKNKIVYFLKGHGERDINSDDREGASRFKKSLEDSSYEVRPLSLVEMKSVPEDADVVAILGGRQPLLDFEAEALKQYTQKGGKLFVAADPGQNHNLGALLKHYGIEFQNNYIIDMVGQLVGQSAAMAIGMVFSRDSEITKKFHEMMTAFQLASALKKADSAPANYQYEELVKSSPQSFAKKEIAGQVRPAESDPKGPLTIAMSVTGKTGEGENAKEFSVVAVGDSDFLTNQMLQMQLNRDLAANSLSFLARDTELVSIRPKQPKGTALQMTQNTASAVLYGIYFPLPFVMFLLGTLLWWRRRGA